MKPTLSVFDDFMDDPADLRARAIKAGFGTHTGPDGAEYAGISLAPVQDVLARISDVMGAPIIPRTVAFRLNLKGEKTHCWIHSDSICAEYASILYLNPPEQCQGGTAFWQHRLLGIDRMPAAAEIQARGASVDAFCAAIRRDCEDPANWQQIGFIGMAWNRFVIYPTSLFHSRFPEDPFGSTPEDGRLILVAFFDLAPNQTPPAPMT